MTPEQSKQFNRDQLTKIIFDLANRAKETDELALASILYVIAGSMAEGTEMIPATLLNEYARMRMEMAKGDQPPKE